MKVRARHCPSLWFSRRERRHTGLTTDSMIREIQVTCHGDILSGGVRVSFRKVVTFQPEKDGPALLDTTGWTMPFRLMGQPQPTLAGEAVHKVFVGVWEAGRREVQATEASLAKINK